MSKIVKSILSSDLSVLGYDGFADAEATADLVAEAIRNHVAREREVDSMIGRAVGLVYDAAPQGLPFSADLLKGFVTARAESVGLTIAEVNDGFAGWVKRNVVDHKDAAPGVRFVSKRGPGEGIRRVE